MRSDQPHRPSDPTDIPSAHLLRAAVRAATLIDAVGSAIPAARSAYLLYPSDALFPPEDLQRAERILVNCGLLAEKEGYLHPTERLRLLTQLDENSAVSVLFQVAVHTSLLGSIEIDEVWTLPQTVTSTAEELFIDPDRREALLISLAQRYGEGERRVMGLRGEEFVVEEARRELVVLGLHKMAAHVHRVSEFSDELGYDVVAPRVGGTRRLEVKTSARAEIGLVHFFISRNEVEWGLCDNDWALVACRIRPNAIELVGWCRARAFQHYLPVDGESCRWASAELYVPESLFIPGLPSPI